MSLLTEGGTTSGINLVTTTFYREIVYNAEHTLHHLALIKVALREMELDIVGDDFGMAYSTLKFAATKKQPLKPA